MRCWDPHAEVQDRPLQRERVLRTHWRPRIFVKKFWLAAVRGGPAGEIRLYLAQFGPHPPLVPA